MMIKANLCCINSRADMYGNRYWAFQFTDNETGQRICGNISGGKSNISAIVREMGLTWEQVYYYREELSIREFNRRTKEWRYAGCRPEELVAFINRDRAAFVRKPEIVQVRHEDTGCITVERKS